MYVNGYILSVPEDKKEAYINIATKFAEILKDFGVLEIFENWEADVPDGEATDFRKAVKANPDEKIVYSWAVWPDKETSDTAHKGMMEDPRMKDFGKMPFNGKHMIIGNFEPILSYRKGEE